MSEGPEKLLRGRDQLLQRRISIAVSCGVGSGVFWLIPIVLAFMPGVHRGALVLLVSAATTGSVCSVVVGVVMQGHRDALRRFEECRQILLGSHEHLVGVLLENELTAQHERATLKARIDEVAGQVMRDYWQIYNDAQTDMQGGREVVDSTATRRINVGAVVPLRVNGRR